MGGTSDPLRPAASGDRAAKHGRPFRGDAMSGPDLSAVIAVRLACASCLEERRIDADLVDDLSAAASAWIEVHNAPEVVAIETEVDGEVAEWVPAP